MQSSPLNVNYRSVFIIDDRAIFESLKNFELGKRDLVLTFDWGLYFDLLNSGYPVAFVDKLCDKDENQLNNFVLRDYVTNWHRTTSGEETLSLEGVSFGSVLKLVVANEIFYSVRLYKCLEKIRTLTYENVIVASQEKIIETILDSLQIKYEFRNVLNSSNPRAYYFPINSWLEEKLGKRKKPEAIVLALLNIRNRIALSFDKLMLNEKILKRIYIHEYHPTREIIREFQKQNKIQVVLGQTSLQRGWWSTLFRDRPIPYKRISRSDYSKAKSLVVKFQQESTFAPRIVNDEFSAFIKSRIADQILKSLPSYLRIKRSLDQFMVHCKFDLIVLISDQGPQEIIRQMANTKLVPSYLILNGLMTSDFSDEARMATWINCYSDSIRSDYYQNTENSLPLGDPRMDSYSCENNTINQVQRKKFVIAVGAAGFNHLDLNSYSAFEFDFIFQVLEAIKIWSARGYEVDLRILVRSNGYLGDYQSFINEYFTDLDVRISQGIGIKDFLSEAMLYISFYSQSLFEASCMGIPTVYHKADREVINRPFDGESELVTTYSVTELIDAIDSAKNDPVRFQGFLDREIMEKYVGPLGGKNLSRNIIFINKLIQSE